MSEMSAEAAHCAYKVVPIANGVMFLFETVDKEGLHVKPELNLFQGDLFLEFGRNIVLMTPDVLNELITAPFIVFACSARDAYHVNEVEMSYAVDPLFLSRLQGALEVLRPS